MVEQTRGLSTSPNAPKARLPRAGEAGSKGLLVVLSLGCFLQHVACGDPDGAGNPLGSSTTLEVDTLQALLQGVSAQVVLPALNQFLDDAATLEQATGAWNDALESGQSGVEERATAQDAWWVTMASWQELEVMQIGPAASSLTAAGGLDLRDELYSWPSVNPCRVDQETVDAEWDSDAFFTERLVNVYGLDALEYLLFNDNSDNDCPGQLDINASGSWDALGESGVWLNRSAYTYAIAKHLGEVGQDLHDRWEPNGGDFGAQLSMVEGADTYESSTVALNAVFDGLFYLETRTKDEKLAHPLGLLDCGASDCLEDVESPFSHGSTAWVHANLLGFQKLFTGADGTGMDDLLIEMGHQDLADRMNNNLARAIETSGSLDASLDTLFEQDQALALQFYDEVKAITDDLKGDLSTVLALQIPSEAAGDND